MNKYLLLVISILSANTVNAIHIGDVTIKKIRLWDNLALVQTNEDMILPDCATNKRWFYVELSEDHASNRKVSVLLAAHAQKKKYNPDCSSTVCYEGQKSWLGSLAICNNPSIE